MNDYEQERQRKYQNAKDYLLKESEKFDYDFWFRQ